MRAEFYQWIQNLAVFYILLSSFLNLVPNGKYEKYIRFFMGLLLIFMMCSPVAAIFGKAENMEEAFRLSFGRENLQRERKEFENMEKLYLEKGYEAEIRRKILDCFRKNGIEAAEADVHIEGEKLQAVIYVEEMPSGEEKRRISDGISEACGLGERDYEIKTAEHGTEGVGSGSATGTFAGSGISSCLPQRELPGGTDGEAPG